MNNYDLVTNPAYIDQSWLNYKATNLWTDNDGHYEWFVQEICAPLRLENNWRSAWGAYCDNLRCCPDCGVATGTLHNAGCDIERCPDCGRQYISCGCHGTENRIPWTGEWPGKRECREFGWYAKLVPGVPGWVPCAPDDPGAHEDLNRLHIDAVWSRERQRFVLPAEISLYGEPIPAEIWTKAIAALAAYHDAGLRWIIAQKPKSGFLYERFCEAEKAYNQMANAIWFAKWTRDQRAEWATICADNVAPQ